MTTLEYHGIPQRLDTLLVAHFGYSRNFFHHIISRGGVMMEGLPLKKSQRILPGTILMIDDLVRYTSLEILWESPEIVIPIVYQHDDYVVIHKPKWVLSHPTSIREVHQPSVVGRLYHTYGKMPGVWPFVRAGLLHRLDRETDGLMLIPLCETALSRFKNLFVSKSSAVTLWAKQAVRLKKYYKAVVRPTSLGRTMLMGLTLPHIIQSLIHPKVPHPPAPKIGITIIHASTVLNPTTYVLDIEILTGRTHQIRYHLAQMGLPIVGDYLYGKDEHTPLGLTAYQLEFEDHHGVYHTITLPE